MRTGGTATNPPADNTKWVNTYAHEQRRALEAADFGDQSLWCGRAVTLGSMIQDRRQGPEVEVQPHGNTFVQLS